MHLTAHQRIALTRIGFRFEPWGARGFFAVLDHNTTAWPMRLNYSSRYACSELSPVEIAEIRFAVFPGRDDMEIQVRASSEFLASSGGLVFFEPYLDDEALAAQDRLRDFVEGLAC